MLGITCIEYNQIYGFPYSNVPSAQIIITLNANYILIPWVIILGASMPRS